MKNVKPFNPKLRKMARAILLVGLTLTLTLGLFDLGRLNSAADPTSPDFAITTNPSSLTIFIGACASKVINITSINGFTGPVSLTTAVSPGFIATISPLGVNVPAGGSAFATKTVCVAPPIAPGSYPETITGTSGALSQTITETDTVPSILSDFSITANPSSLTILSGSCANKTIIITAIGNYTGTIALTTTVSGGLTAFLGAVSVTLPPSPQTLVKTVCAPVAVPPGSYVETVIGTDLTGLSHSFNETDTVVGPADFTMVPSTTSLVMPPGSCSSKTITITGVNNYTGTITLTTSIVPPGLTATLSPSTVSLPPSPQTVTKTVCASINTPPGTYTETVTGTDTSGLTHSITETDTVPPIVTTPCFFFTLNGKPVSQKYCNPRANDLKIDFKPLLSAGCTIQFTSNGVPNGIPLLCPPGANDVEIFWKITPTAATITRCIWTLDENRLPFPCPVPQGSNDFRFFAAGGITQVFWTINGLLLPPPILPAAAVLANDVDFFFVRAQPSLPCFFFTLNGQPTSGNNCNSVANDLKIDFAPGGTCYIQYTFLGTPTGQFPCPTLANDIDVVWKTFATGPVIVGCFWTFNETPLTLPCTVPPGSNGFRFFATGGIIQVFWTINLGMIMPAIIPIQPVNDVEFLFI